MTDILVGESFKLLSTSVDLEVKATVRKYKSKRSRSHVEFQCSPALRELATVISPSSPHSNCEGSQRDRLSTAWQPGSHTHAENELRLDWQHRFSRSEPKAGRKLSQHDHVFLNHRILVIT